MHHVYAVCLFVKCTECTCMSVMRNECDDGEAAATTARRERIDTRGVLADLRP